MWNLGDAIFKMVKMTLVGDASLISSSQSDNKYSSSCSLQTGNEPAESDRLYKEQSKGILASREVINLCSLFIDTIY